MITKFTIFFCSGLSKVSIMLSKAELCLYVLLYWWWLQGKEETDPRVKRNKELKFPGEDWGCTL
jgi:hypothetical protein